MHFLILTFTPNPALDIGGDVSHLLPNEKNYVHHQTKSPGGNGVNVARILTRLKVPVIASGIYFGRIPEVKIQSTVGAGDSMVGAMIAQFYMNNNSDADILRSGLAAAAATLSMRGTSLGSAKQIRDLYQRTLVKKIK